MEKEALIKIGKLSKPHGLKGEVRAMIELSFLERIKKFDVIFVMIKNNPLPYFIEQADISDNGSCLLKLEEVNDRTGAEIISGKEFFIDKKNLKKAVKETGYGFLIGYKLLEQGKGVLGVIENIYELPAHALAQLTIDSKEVLIPLTGEMIVKTDKRKKEVTVTVSEGLLDVFLSP